MSNWPGTILMMTPWSAQQVEELNRSQGDGTHHGYTCPHDHGEDSRILLATEDGWTCPSCDYTQNWFRAGAIGRIAFLAPNVPTHKEIECPKP